MDTAELTNALLPPFANPVDDSQRMFRSLLKSMAEPGVIGQPPADVADSGTMHSTLYATSWSIARTLFDHDTLIYVSPKLRNESVLRSILFQTDARTTDSQSDANFALISLDELVQSNEFNLGSLERPHESCTVIVQVDSISDSNSNEDSHIELSGPGIESTRLISIEPLKRSLIELLQNNHALYPCGLDFIFCSAKDFVALPRTTSVRTKLNIAEENKVQDQIKGESSCM